MILKCIFNSWDCRGTLLEKNYDKPSHYFDWPKIYTCKFHKRKKVGWKDALNTRSNVLVNNRKMTHTKELVGFQGLDECWLGITVNIELHSLCGGSGCIECNYTGREKHNERQQSQSVSE